MGDGALGDPPRAGIWAAPTGPGGVVGACVALPDASGCTAWPGLRQPLTVFGLASRRVGTASPRTTAASGAAAHCPVSAAARRRLPAPADPPEPSEQPAQPGRRAAAALAAGGICDLGCGRTGRLRRIRAPRAQMGARRCACLFSRLCLWLVLYGVGTTAALQGPTPLPANTAAPVIRSDASRLA